MGEYIFLVLFASLQFVLHQLDQTIYLKKHTNGTSECTVAASHYGTVTKVIRLGLNETASTTHVSLLKQTHCY